MDVELLLLVIASSSSVAVALLFVVSFHDQLYNIHAEYPNCHRENAKISHRVYTNLYVTSITIITSLCVSLTSFIAFFVLLLHQHCVWTTKCVGGGNVIYFYSWLVSAVMSIVYIGVAGAMITAPMIDHL